MDDRTQQAIMTAFPSALIAVYSVMLFLSGILIGFSIYCLHKIRKQLTFKRDKVMTMTAVCQLLCLLLVFTNNTLRILGLLHRYYNQPQSGKISFDQINIMMYTFTIMWVFIAFVFDIYKWSLFIVSADSEINPYHANDIMRARHRSLKTALVMS